MFARRCKRSLRSQSAGVLLHRLAVTLAFDSQNGIASIGAITAAGTLPISPRENDVAYRTHQMPFFGAAIFFFSTAATVTDRRPFFSAVSILRPTASPRI